MTLNDFREMARFTPVEHCSVGFIDAMDALRANREELAALLAKFPCGYQINADLRRLHHRTAAAVADAEKRFAMAHPQENIA